jgi:hypothetical protein
MNYRSIAKWPDSVNTGRPENESFDTHPTKEDAEAVCRMLQIHGLGGEGKIFPLSTRVEEVEQPP